MVRPTSGSTCRPFPIPSGTREQLSLRDGDHFVVNAVDGRMVMESQRHMVDRTAGIFANYAKRPPLRPSEERRLFRRRGGTGSSQSHGERTVSSAFLDTNVIIRHLLRDNPDQSSRSSRLVAGIVSVTLSDAVAFEDVFVVNQIHRISRSEVADALTVRLDIPGISLRTTPGMLATPDYWPRQSPPSSAGCCHLVSTRFHGLDTIDSFGKVGRYPGVGRSEPERKTPPTPSQTYLHPLFRPLLWTTVRERGANGTQNDVIQ